MKRGLLLAAILVFVCVVAAGSVYAADEDNGFVKFWKGLFQSPGNTVQESAKVIGDTGEKAAGTVAQEIKDVGGTLTGSGDAAKDLIVNPVKGTAETVQTGVVGAANMPAEVAKESWPAEGSK